MRRAWPRCRHSLHCSRLRHFFFFDLIHISFFTVGKENSFVHAPILAPNVINLGTRVGELTCVPSPYTLFFSFLFLLSANQSARAHMCARRNLPEVPNTSVSPSHFLNHFMISHFPSTSHPLPPRPSQLMPWSSGKAKVGSSPATDKSVAVPSTLPLNTVSVALYKVQMLIINASRMSKSRLMIALTHVKLMTAKSLARGPRTLSSSSPSSL